MLKNHLINQQIYNKIETDFRVEAVVANLLKYYDGATDYFIQRIGSNDRPYAKDIKCIHTNNYGLDEQTVIIETYRESIYDYLPEGLFHPPSLGNFNHNVDSIVREIRRQKEIEENARIFFQPFEIEIFKTEVLALLKETELDVVDDSGTLLKILEDVWPLITKVDKHTAQTLVFILPFLHKVRGKKNCIERFLSAFLNMPVSIDFVPNIIEHSDDADATTLGKTRLGISFIPNRKHYDGERNWQINIGPIHYTDIEKFVPGNPFRNLLNQIYDYLLPVSVNFFENFITVKSPESFCLSSEKDTSRLGFATFI